MLKNKKCVVCGAKACDKSTYVILKRFDKLPSAEKIEVLYGALSVMQSYNNQSQSDCICQAMGYKRSPYSDDFWVKEE